MTEKKTLDVTDMDDLKNKVSDVKTAGNPGKWILLCKASSESQGWMKSTKVMTIPYLGVLVSVSTQQGDQIAEALEFVPGASLTMEECGQFGLDKACVNDTGFYPWYGGPQGPTGIPTGAPCPEPKSILDDRLKKVFDLIVENATRQQERIKTRSARRVELEAHDKLRRKFYHLQERADRLERRAELIEKSQEFLDIDPESSVGQAYHHAAVALGELLVEEKALFDAGIEDPSYCVED